MICLVQVLYYEATSVFSKKGKGKHLNCKDCPLKVKCSYGVKKDKE